MCWVPLYLYGTRTRTLDVPGAGTQPKMPYRCILATNSRPTCQVCHKVGHNALDCYHQYDHAYQSTAGNQMMAYYTTPQIAADSA